MPCSACGKKVPLKARFCPSCGADLSEAARGEQLRKKVPQRTKDAEAAGDETLWQGGFSRLAMLGWWIAGGVLTLAVLLLAASSRTTQSARLGMLVGLGLFWLVLAGRYFYLRLSHHYILSRQRLVHHSGLLWRDTDRVEVIDVDDVSFSQGPVERLVGIGTIWITSSDQSHPELTLLGIAEVESVAIRIDNARREERQKRGLYIESV